MLNFLRIILTVLTALVVFGWSLVAANEYEYKSVVVSANEDQPDSVRTVEPYATLNTQFNGVRLEAMPQIPVKQNGPGTTSSAGTFRKAKFDATPKFSRPDFGSIPRLAPKPIEFEQLRQAIARAAIGQPKWISERGLFESRSLEDQLVTENKELPRFTASAPAARVALGDEVANTTLPDALLVDTEPNEATKSKTVSLRPARLNFRALQQKVDAHNFSIAAIDQQIQSKDQWNVDGIELVVDQIAEVFAEQSVWSMYIDLLEPSKRRRIGSVSELDDSLTALRERIFEARVEADVDRQSTYISKTKTKRRLDDLDRRIQEWLRP